MRDMHREPLPGTTLRLVLDAVRAEREDTSSVELAEKIGVPVNIVTSALCRLSIRGYLEKMVKERLVVIHIPARWRAKAVVSPPEPEFIRPLSKLTHAQERDLLMAYAEKRITRKELIDRLGE